MPRTLVLRLGRRHPLLLAAGALAPRDPVTMTTGPATSRQNLAGVSHRAAPELALTAALTQGALFRDHTRARTVRSPPRSGSSGRGGSAPCGHGVGGAERVALVGSVDPVQVEAATVAGDDRSADGAAPLRGRGHAGTVGAENSRLASQRCSAGWSDVIPEGSEATEPCPPQPRLPGTAPRVRQCRNLNGPEPWGDQSRSRKCSRPDGEAGVVGDGAQPGQHARA